MKPKKLEKKLSLNKATIARLQDSDMNGIKGGDSQVYPGCWSTITCQYWICNSDITCVRFCPD